MSRRIAATLILALGALSCGNDESCDACGIRAREVAVLGAEDGDGALESFPVVGALPDGGFVVLQPDRARLLPRMYDRSGHFTRTLGATGDGPGEFRSSNRLVVSADSIILFDSRALRYSVVDSSGRVVRGGYWPLTVHDAIELPDGRIVATRNGTGHATSLTLLDRGGNVVRAFGDTVRRGDGRFVLANAADGSIWAAPSLGRLELAQWDSLGRERARLLITTEHFAPYEAFSGPSETSPPKPELRGMWADTTGGLWLVVSVPAVDWQSGIGESRVGEGGARVTQVRDPNRLYDTVVLRVSARTGELLSERRLPGWFYHVSAAGLLVRMSQTSDGWYRAHLWRIELQ